MKQICKDEFTFPHDVLFLDSNQKAARKAGVHVVNFPEIAKRNTFPEKGRYGDSESQFFYQHLNNLLEDFKSKMNEKAETPRGLKHLELETDGSCFPRKRSKSDSDSASDSVTRILDNMRSSKLLTRRPP